MRIVVASRSVFGRHGERRVLSALVLIVEEEGEACRESRFQPDRFDIFRFKGDIVNISIGGAGEGAITYRMILLFFGNNRYHPGIGEI